MAEIFTFEIIGDYRGAIRTLSKIEDGAFYGKQWDT